MMKLIVAFRKFAIAPKKAGDLHSAWTVPKFRPWFHMSTADINVWAYRSFATTFSQFKICNFFQEKLLKVLKCYYFLWVQRRHNCSPAVSFANCDMTLYPLKLHLQTFLSIQITQKCQILSCDALVANERYVGGNMHAAEKVQPVINMLFWNPFIREINASVNISSVVFSDLHERLWICNSGGYTISLCFGFSNTVNHFGQFAIQST